MQQEVVLAMLAKEPSHGYELRARLARALGPVAEGISCVPSGALPAVTTPPAGFVIIGGGKTAMDAVCWLLDRGTPPPAIMTE